MTRWHGLDSQRREEPAPIFFHPLCGVVISTDESSLQQNITSVRVTRRSRRLFACGDVWRVSNDTLSYRGARTTVNQRSRWYNYLHGHLWVKVFTVVGPIFLNLILIPIFSIIFIMRVVVSGGYGMEPSGVSHGSNLRKRHGTDWHLTLPCTCTPAPKCTTIVHRSVRHPIDI